MKNSLFIAALIVFVSQMSLADALESCQLETHQVVVEDGLHGGIQVALIYEGENLLSVSDEMHLTTYQIQSDNIKNNIQQISENTDLADLINSLQPILENASEARKLEVGQEATVIRFMDTNGKVMAKIGQIGQQKGLCQPDSN